MNKTDFNIPVSINDSSFDPICKVCNHKIMEFHLRNKYGTYCIRCSGSWAKVDYGILTPFFYGFPVVLFILGFFEPIIFLFLLPAIIGIPAACLFTLWDIRRHKK